MIEKSRSNFSLRLKTTFFKVMIEFRWSLRREGFSHLGSCGGAVARENGQFICQEMSVGRVGDCVW